MSALRLSLITAAAFALSFGAAAYAHDHSGGDHMRGQKRFEASDTNHDGFIDKSEASDRLAKHFDDYDADKDGKLSLDEIGAGMKARWRGMRAERIKARIADVDSDKDGRLSWAEMSAQAKSRFDKLDTNQDGYIDESEMTNGRAQWGGHRHHHHHADGDGN